MRTFRSAETLGGAICGTRRTFGARRSLLAIAVVAALAVLSTMTRAQRPGEGVPRLRDGHANLNGIWQANNTANWDLEPHAGAAGPGGRAGRRVQRARRPRRRRGQRDSVQPDALAKKKQNAAELDDSSIPRSSATCRASRAPPTCRIPSRSSSRADDILITYEFASASRIVRMNTTRRRARSPAWMGWSRGRWDGDTLVVDVTDFNGRDLVRPRRQLPQRRAARRRALHADRRRHAAVRSDDRGSEGVHAAVEDQHAALSPARDRTRSCRIQVRRVRRRADVRPPREAVGARQETARLRPCRAEDKRIRGEASA